MNTVVKDLITDWKFHLGECEDAWYKGYDDSSWRKVMIPHDWSVEFPFSKEYSSGTGYLCGGIGWYRLHFTIPEEYRGKSIRMVFDGVYKNSQVWCNSYYLGKRPNGYTDFSYDITDFACFGEQENLISVKVTHNDIADSRWFTGSGITRKVTLVIEEEVHPAEHGCFFETREIENCAGLRVTHKIVNTALEDKELTLETLWYDKENQITARVVKEVYVPAQSTAEQVLETVMEHPKLWSPETPNLYRMETWYQISGAERYLVDSTKVGIRTFFFDPDKGFFLNGRNRKLKGVCVHHDGGCLGAAMKKEVWQRRLQLLKESGCNAIRGSHNPHMPELYDLCDEMGFCVIDEAFDEWENPKNKWSTGHNVYPPKHQGYYEDFPQWHEADLRAMIRRDRNHPSVIMWSIGNEIDYPNDPYCHPLFDTMTGNNDANKPAKERMYDKNKPNAERLVVLAKHLAGIVKEADRSRPVSLAAAFPELSAKLGFLEPLDVAGYNYKEHLYQEHHKMFPRLPLLGSENGHSYEAWCAVNDNDYIAGQFLWTGIDYLGEAYGWPIHGSAAGIVTSSGYPKPEFYRRKSFWCEEQILQLATCREEHREDRKAWCPMSYSWNYSEQENILVKCYTQLRQGAALVLYLNGEEIGRQTEYVQDGAFCFRVPFAPGKLEAKYYTKEGEVLAENTLCTTKQPHHLACRMWTEADSSEKIRDCHAEETGYLYQLLITVKDEDDRTVVWQDVDINVQVTGAAQLAGMDNGDLADVTPFRENSRKTYEGRLVVYVRRTEPGAIGVTIDGRCEGKRFSLPLHIDIKAENE